MSLYSEMKGIQEECRRRSGNGPFVDCRHCEKYTQHPCWWLSVFHCTPAQWDLDRMPEEAREEIGEV